MTPAHTVVELPREFYILPAFYRRERARLDGSPWPRHYPRKQPVKTEQERAALAQGES